MENLWISTAVLPAADISISSMHFTLRFNSQMNVESANKYLHKKLANCNIGVTHKFMKI